MIEKVKLNYLPKWPITLSLQKWPNLFLSMFLPKMDVNLELRGWNLSLIKYLGVTFDISISSKLPKFVRPEENPKILIKPELINPKQIRVIKILECILIGWYKNTRFCISLFQTKANKTTSFSLTMVFQKNVFLTLFLLLNYVNLFNRCLI